MATILVIEDEIHILENILETLELEGFQVLGTNNGSEGIELVKAHTPDIVLCDIMMPGLNGYDVLAALRSNMSTATIPFVFLTALTAHEEVRYGMELGADDYLTKPFSPDELLNMVRARLERQKMQQKKFEQDMETMRQRLIYTLPHEFRTPLTSIIGSAEYLLLDYEKITPKRIHHMANLILASAQRLEHLSENYLLYAQIDMLAQDPERVAAMRQDRIDYPAAILLEVAQTVAHHTERADDLVLGDLPDAVVSISHENFRKIAHEIIDNAFKFSQGGDPVTIRADVADDAYVVTISDQGHGMSQQDIEQVGAYVQFQRAIFEQQGLGLGLAIARRLMEIHDGELMLESQLEQGTTVRLKIPILD
jgi:DNA-binding response OmpR family regulator